ncbi:MAG: hypothetical protein ACNS61_06030 [Candidatus Wenzhouxiangella sp. M2_3B_020]
MNKSRDFFIRDLASEEALESARSPGDPELAADRALKRELAGLDRAELPRRARERALSAARIHDRTPWFMAAAATIAAAVAIAVVMRGSEPPAASPTRGEFAELGLALNTINDAGQRAVALAGRKVSRSLVVPELGLAELPYADVVRTALRPPPSGSRNNASTNQENTQ